MDAHGQGLPAEMGTHRNGEKVKIKRHRDYLGSSGGLPRQSSGVCLGPPRPRQPHPTPKRPLPSVLTWHHPTASAAHSPQPLVTLSLTLCPAESRVHSGWSHQPPGLGQL